MKLRTRILAAVLAGLVAGLALMAHDRAKDAGLAVTAAQIANARATGKPELEIAPGTFVTTPVPAEDAWLLPVEWLLVGLGSGFAVLTGTGLRKRPVRVSGLAARDPRRISPHRRR